MAKVFSRLRKYRLWEFLKEKINRLCEIDFKEYDCTDFCLKIEVIVLSFYRVVKNIRAQLFKALLV